MIKFADMFAGIGGFRLGIQRAADKLNIPVKCVFSSEIDKHTVKVYEKNFGDTPSGDITKINATEIDDIDILCGGFPCQDVSTAGKRVGLCGSRTGLFFEIIRIAKEKQPKIIFLENVKGLLSSNKGWDFARVIIELEDIGYEVESMLLNSKDFGVPQNRERVFIVGHLRGSGTGKVFPIYGETSTNTWKNSSMCLDANHSKCSASHGSITGITYYPVLDPTTVNKSCNGRRIKNQDDHMFTLTAWDIHGVLITGLNIKSSGGELRKDGLACCIKAGESGTKNHIIGSGLIRKLTPVECERLQSYPDNYTAGISDTMRYKCLGNAVTVNVIEAIAEKMLMGLKDE